MSLAIKAVSTIGKQQMQLQTPTKPSGGKDFKEVMNKVDLHSELQQMQKDLISGKSFAPHELIHYQVKANQFHLRVEMLSKASEGILAGVRKFQQGQ